MRHSPVPMTASGSTRFDTDFEPGTCVGKVDVRLPGKGNSKWIRTSRLSIKNSLSALGCMLHALAFRF